MRLVLCLALVLLCSQNFSGDRVTVAANLEATSDPPVESPPSSVDEAVDVDVKVETPGDLDAKLVGGEDGNVVGETEVGGEEDGDISVGREAGEVAEDLTEAVEEDATGVSKDAQEISVEEMGEQASTAREVLKGGNEGATRSNNPFVRAFKGYDELLKKHYLKLSFVQATTLGVVGDTLAQYIEHRRGKDPHLQPSWFNRRRALDAGILTMVIDGIFTPQWYNILERVSEKRTLGVVLGKAFAASAIYGPFANGLFLAGVPLLRRGWQGIKDGFDWTLWRKQLAVAMIRDFQMWPPLNIISFWLLPKHWRPLMAHVVGVGLIAVLSCTSLSDNDLPLGEASLRLLRGWAGEATNGARAGGAWVGKKLGRPI